MAAGRRERATRVLACSLIFLPGAVNAGACTPSLSYLALYLRLFYLLSLSLTSPRQVKCGGKTRRWKRQGVWRQAWAVKMTTMACGVKTKRRTIINGTAAASVNGEQGGRQGERAWQAKEGAGGAFLPLSLLPTLLRPPRGGPFSLDILGMIIAHAAGYLPMASARAGRAPHGR